MIYQIVQFLSKNLFKFILTKYFSLYITVKALTFLTMNFCEDKEIDKEFKPGWYLGNLLYERKQSSEYSDLFSGDTYKTFIFTGHGEHKLPGTVVYWVHYQGFIANLATHRNTGHPRV